MFVHITECPKCGHEFKGEVTRKLTHDEIEEWVKSLVDCSEDEIEVGDVLDNKNKTFSIDGFKVY